MSVDFCLTTSSNTASIPFNAKTVIIIVIYVGSDLGIKSRKMSVKKHIALKSIIIPRRLVISYSRLIVLIL